MPGLSAGAADYERTAPLVTGSERTGRHLFDDARMKSEVLKNVFMTIPQVFPLKPRAGPALIEAGPAFDGVSRKRRLFCPNGWETGFPAHKAVKEGEDRCSDADVGGR